MPNTTEQTVSKTKEEVIKEAKRIEESTLYSSRRHFVAASIWRGFHLWIGIPMVLLSSIAGAAAFAQFDSNHLIGGIISIIVASLSGLITFLNPNDKANAHFNAGNNYDSLHNNVRVFWSIDCWSGEAEDILTQRLKYFSEQKEKLNQNSPQTLKIAYWLAKRGIIKGEAEYKVDKVLEIQ